MIRLYFAHSLVVVLLVGETEIESRERIKHASGACSHLLALISPLGSYKLISNFLVAVFDLVLIV